MKKESRQNQPCVVNDLLILFFTPRSAYFSAEFSIIEHFHLLWNKITAFKNQNLTSLILQQTRQLLIIENTPYVSSSYAPKKIEKKYWVLPCALWVYNFVVEMALPTCVKQTGVLGKT